MGTWWWASLQGIFIFLLVFVLPTLIVKCFIPFRVTSAIFSESHSPKVPLIWSQSTAGTTVATIFSYFYILNVLIWGALILHRLPFLGCKFPQVSDTFLQVYLWYTSHQSRAHLYFLSLLQALTHLSTFLLTWITPGPGLRQPGTAHAQEPDKIIQAIQC